MSLVSRTLRVARRELLFDFRSTLAVAGGRASSAYWSRSSETRKNFGDALSPLVLESMIGRTVVHSSEVFRFGPWNNFYCIGSILDNLVSRNAIVIGAGFKHPDAKVFVKPKRVLAVRGPGTKAVFERNGVLCPDIYCDPGLLASKVFPYCGSCSGDVGVVLHYADKRIWSGVQRFEDGDSYRIIDIEAPVAEVASSIASCRLILSSSLHGIIAAHSYGIPSVWLRLSDSVAGKGFKFFDYFSSIGCDSPPSIDAEDGLNLKAVVKVARAFEVQRNVDFLLSQVPELRSYA